MTNEKLAVELVPKYTTVKCRKCWKTYDLPNIKAKKQWFICPGCQ